MEYYSTIKKNDNLPSVRIQMDLEDIMLSEIKSDRERQILHFLGGLCPGHAEIPGPGIEPELQQ